jgi:hypothetical protein
MAGDLGRLVSSSLCYEQLTLPLNFDTLEQTINQERTYHG